MGCTISRWNEVKEVQLNQTLTQRQIQLTRDTWQLLSDDMEGTGILIFRRLFETQSDLKTLFVRLGKIECSNDPQQEDINMDEYMLKKHAHVVMEALGAAVECLEDSAFLSSVLMALGQIHASYHVRPQYLPRLWPSIRYGLKEVLQDVFTEEVEDTWKIVFNYIISKMKDGIKMERKAADGNSCADPDDT